jgi:3'(2'), 5'-bisphosphate nucleotidase
VVLRHYGAREIETQLKADRSPLTAADVASHDFIVSRLEAITPWPVLSEESAEIPYDSRRSWSRFWLVDPLDGTKEFVKRNGEFTVNIALIEAGSPVLGVVHAPARSLTYFAARSHGAFFKKGAAQPVRLPQIESGEARLTVVVSRSHADAQTADFLSTLGAHQALSIGSSLKFCVLAEGRAHVYPRFGPTMEWDTAAGHCVLEEAGGSVRDLEDRPLLYNKRDLRNPFFIARGQMAVSTS